MTLEEQQQKDREIAENDALELAGAYEEMVNTVGWANIKSYYQTQLSAFLNSVILNDKKPIAEFEGARNELIGMRKMIGHVSSSLDFLKEYRKKNEKPATK